MATKKPTLASLRKLTHVTCGHMANVFNVSRDYIKKALDGMEPVMSYPGGRGLVLVYDAPKAIAAVERYIEARRPKMPDVAPVIQPAPMLAKVNPDDPLRLINQSINVLGSGLKAVLDEQKANGTALEGIADIVKSLADQNKVLFKELQRINTELQKRPQATQVLPDGETPAPAPPVAFQAPKLRVAVVGLTGHLRTLVAMRYKDKLDVRFWDPSEARSKDFGPGIKYCDHAFLMVNFLSHSSVDMVKSVGTPFTTLHNGGTVLNEAIDKWLEERA